jgi:uncharacterized protein
MLVVGVSCSDDGPSAEPATSAPPTSVAADHEEIDLEFTSGGSRLAGTLLLPISDGDHPAVVWVHGSGPQTRLGYGELVRSLVRSNVAFFSYDKRGAGESEGECCPADDEGAGLAEFQQQADDALAALTEVGKHPGIDADRVGLIGVSQAGWIVPIAASGSDAVAFTVLASAPTVTTGEEHLYSSLTGDADVTDDGDRQRLSTELAAHGPSGFDPEPFLAKMNAPALWLYGGLDGSVPVIESVNVLNTLKGTAPNFRCIVFPDGGHGLLDVDPPPPPEVIPTITAWLRDHGFT